MLSSKLIRCVIWDSWLPRMVIYRLRIWGLFCKGMCCMTIAEMGRISTWNSRMVVWVFSCFLFVLFYRGNCVNVFVLKLDTLNKTWKCVYLVTLYLYRQHVCCLDGMKKLNVRVSTNGQNWGFQNHLYNPVRLNTHQCEFSLHMGDWSQLGLSEIIYIIRFYLVQTNVNFYYISMQLLHDRIVNNAITTFGILIKKLVGFHRVTYNLNKVLNFEPLSDAYLLWQWNLLSFT